MNNINKPKTKPITQSIKQNRPFFFFVVALFIVRGVLANHYFVPSPSMVPTLLPGDVIGVNRVAYDLKLPFSQKTLYKLSEPRRGDIVVFDSPVEDRLLVKRLVALPGDQVAIINGYVWVNGKPMHEGSPTSVQSHEEQTETHHFMVQRLPEAVRPENLAFEVPTDKYFFMGDNRDNSADGRYFGFVPRQNLVGRVEGVLLSLAHLRFLKNLRGI